MGILNGGIRLRRYQVMGEVPSGFQETFEEAIQRHEFVDFAADDGREEALGWVGVDDWFRPGLHAGRWLIDQAVCLALRVDTKRIPRHYLKQQCRAMEAEWKLKAGREDLTRAEREEIEGIVHKRLLERVIPSSQGLDMAWDLDRSDLLFWSSSDKANDAFKALFERTFGLKLRPLFPYLVALRVLGPEAAEVADRVVPADFRPAGGA
ncbi:MAG: recombination-associated protein RdgC [Deferrisomatales bacterium]